MTHPGLAACVFLGKLAMGTKVRSSAVSASGRYRLLVSTPRKTRSPASGKGAKSTKSWRRRSASIWPSSRASYKLAQVRSKKGENDNSGKLLAPASLQKLFYLQRWSRRRLGGCSHTRTDDRGQRESAGLPAGLFRLLYRLGVDDDCPLRLSAAEALGGEPPPGMISSIDSPCGPRASDTQRAARPTSFQIRRREVVVGTDGSHE